MIYTKAVSNLHLFQGCSAVYLNFESCNFLILNHSPNVGYQSLHISHGFILCLVGALYYYFDFNPLFLDSNSLCIFVIEAIFPHPLGPATNLFKPPVKMPQIK